MTLCPYTTYNYSEAMYQHVHVHPAILCTSIHTTHSSMSVHSSHLQVTPPESVRGRLSHSITATSLGPGLTEVLMFGGVLGGPFAETTILRFGEGVLYCTRFAISIQDYICSL